MAAENASQREFAQLVADHFFGNENLQKRFAVVNEERVADKFGDDRASARPSLNRFFFALLIELFDFSEKFIINERTIFK